MKSLNSVVVAVLYIFNMPNSDMSVNLTSVESCLILATKSTYNVTMITFYLIWKNYFIKIKIKCILLKNFTSWNNEHIYMFICPHLNNIWIDFWCSNVSGCSFNKLIKENLVDFNPWLIAYWITCWISTGSRFRKTSIP